MYDIVLLLVNFDLSLIPYWLASKLQQQRNMKRLLHILEKELSCTFCVNSSTMRSLYSCKLEKKIHSFDKWAKK